MRMRCTVEPLHRKRRCRLVKHKWAPMGGSVGDTIAVTSYSECVHCGARRVVQQGSGYRPVDWQWLCWNAREVRD